MPAKLRKRRVSVGSGGVAALAGASSRLARAVCQAASATAITGVITMPSSTPLSSQFRAIKLITSSGWSSAITALIRFQARCLK